MKRLIILCLTICLSSGLFAQTDQDPEFRKGYIIPVELHSGLTTRFNKSPELFTGGVFINPQWTIIQNLLRVGPSAGINYNNKKVAGIFGVSAAFKIKTLSVQYMGSYANLYVVGNAQWGTSRQQMAGAGFGIEALKRVHVQLRFDRDYHLKNWWFQSVVGINIWKTKENKDD